MSSNLLVCLLVVCLTSIEAIRPYRVTGIITCKSSPGASVPMFNEEIEVVAVSASGLSEAIGHGFSAQDGTFVVFPLHTTAFPVNEVEVNAIEAAVHCNGDVWLFTHIEWIDGKGRIRTIRKSFRSKQTF
ncbi:hypothetical protein M3Y94_00657700 [Aphelenchoides besseyi]|nr:hypothetical protein M3Y94_00657700 [Aphelenchoides besseyi]KAI6231199.1 hypothetical protein M3Y95_00356200 [Aphelenchoides besseyi]